jgi:hypothetical protein
MIKLRNRVPNKKKCRSVLCRPVAIVNKWIWIRCFRSLRVVVVSFGEKYVELFVQINWVPRKTKRPFSTLCTKSVIFSFGTSYLAWAGSKTCKELIIRFLQSIRAVSSCVTAAYKDTILSQICTFITIDRMLRRTIHQCIIIHLLFSCWSVCKEPKWR